MLTSFINHFSFFERSYHKNIHTIYYHQGKPLATPCFGPFIFGRPPQYCLQQPLLWPKIAPHFFQTGTIHISQQPAANYTSLSFKPSAFRQGAHQTSSNNNSTNRNRRWFHDYIFQGLENISNSSSIGEFLIVAGLISVSLAAVCGSVWLYTHGFLVLDPARGCVTFANRVQQVQQVSHSFSTSPFPSSAIHCTIGDAQWLSASMGYDLEFVDGPLLDNLSPVHRQFYELGGAGMEYKWWFEHSEAYRKFIEQQTILAEWAQWD